jgi:hypothetical protein
MVQTIPSKLVLKLSRDETPTSSNFALGKRKKSAGVISSK